MRLPFVLPVMLLCLGAAPVAGPATDLDVLIGQVAHLRVTQGANEERNAGPELTPVKRALREWVERQLPAEPAATEPDGGVELLDTSDLAPLAHRMNEQLDAAGLTCGVSNATNHCVAPPDSFLDNRGRISRVELAALDDGRYLLVVTGVGVRCGYDESAYIYEQRADRRWHLLLASEQDDYAKGEYKPQNFISIAVSPSLVAWNEQGPPPLVATLGYSPWCSSNWQMLYTRLWRASATTATPAPLLDRNDDLFRGDYMVAAAQLADHDLLVQYTGGSIDGGVLTRAHVLHYRVAAGDKLERIAPFALDPQSFVEEWLTSDWSQARRWSESPTESAALARLHPPAPGPEDVLSGDFDNSLRRCRRDPTLWQVAVTLDPGDKAPRPPIYFHVRWMPPYRFTLVAAGHRPFAGCNEQVLAPDNVGTLFPLQGWRADAW